MSDITTGQIFTDGERGITAQKLNGIISQAQITPSFYTSKPTAPTADPADQALILKAGAYAVVPISTLAGSATQAQIWSTRLRSFNAIGNPNFEVDQYRSGIVVNPILKIIDRWSCGRTSITGTFGSVVNTGGPIVLPGTNFALSSNYFRFNLTATLSTLASGDYLYLFQSVEGPNWRELASDVHSVSLLVRSSVANLNFGLSLRDSTGTRSLTKLCTLGAANTVTLITLPNLPVWASGGVFTSTPGSVGYLLAITLAAGSTYASPANDTWQNGNFLGAAGQSNFAANPVNSTFDWMFVQHEPGAVCSTLMDKPFGQNLDECLRYYTKSYDYPTLAGTAATPAGSLSFVEVATTALQGISRYPKLLAKTPNIIIYNYSTGAANSVFFGGISYTANAVNGGQGGFSQITTATLPAVVAGATALLHYTADTGW